MNTCKRFKIQYNVGKVKYLVSYHDGEKKHADGSPFFDIKCFNNKKNLKKFTDHLFENGYNFVLKTKKQ